MKQILIIFLFCLNTTSSGEESKDLRRYIRQPYKGHEGVFILPTSKTKPTVQEVLTEEERWKKWWSVQYCGKCSKAANDCSWLNSVEWVIRRKWTFTKKGYITIYASWGVVKFKK